MSTNSISPRIGAAWDLGRDHRTVLRGHYGRYHDALLTGQYSVLEEPGKPAVNHGACCRSRPVCWKSREARVGNFTHLTQYRAAVFDQWVAGVEHQLPLLTALTVR